MRDKKIDTSELTEDEIDNLEEVETITYKPECLEESLECDNDVYEVLEYYTLEWPSQTVSLYKENDLIVSTNPENDESHVVMLNLKSFVAEKNVKNIKSDVSEISCPYNRIRCGININCVSDNSFVIYNENLNEIEKIDYDINVSYGLCVFDNKVLYSTVDGRIFLYGERIIDTYDVHSKSIESISFLDNVIYSSSTDGSVKLTDMRSKDTIFSKYYNVDINAIDVYGNNFIFGDDNGTLRFIDNRMTENEVAINWHKSSISSVRWKNDDVFVACSDEQVCIYDISLEEEWEYEKYLLFVHQGQKYYKDVEFLGDVYVTTSVDGLCFFEPKSFNDSNF